MLQIAGTLRILTYTTSNNQDFKSCKLQSQLVLIDEADQTGIPQKNQTAPLDISLRVESRIALACFLKLADDPLRRPPAHLGFEQ